MKLNKILFYISLSVSIITLTISAILTFAVTTNEINEFITNILLNIFAGTVVMIATTLVDYFINRRKTFERIMKNLSYLANEFSKLEYLDENDNYTLDQYIDYYKNSDNEIMKNMKEKELEEHFNVDKENSLQQNKMQMENIMNTYIHIANLNLDEISELYRDLDLLTDFRNKKKKILYNDIFNYIWDLLKKIDDAVYHFNIYKNEFQNYKVNYSKMRELQKNFFHYEEQDLDDNTPFKDVDKFGIDCSSSGGYNNIAKKQYIVINKITGYLRQQYENIGKLAYFDKSYDAHIGKAKKRKKK